MALVRLLLSTILFHWRGNLAVLLGVAVGSAVLTGALLVGDSLQGSLLDRSLRQLGWIKQTLVTPRFVRQQLANELRDVAERIEPAILLRSTVASGERQARGVTVLGVEATFFGEDAAESGVFVNETLARELHLQAGSMVEIRLSKPSALPREAALSRKEVEVKVWTVPVTRVLHGDEAGNDFNLRPGVESPRNLFVPLAELQRQLELPDEINALLARGETAKLNATLARSVQLADYGLTLFTPAARAKALLDRYDRPPGDGVLRGSEWTRRRVAGQRKPRFAEVIFQGLHQAKPEEITLAELTDYFQRKNPYLALESKQLLLPPTWIPADTPTTLHLDGQAVTVAPTAVYFCRLDGQGLRQAGVVAALPRNLPAPLGPFQPEGLGTLSSEKIILVEEAWPKEQRPAIGSTLTLRYKPPESHGPAEDRTRAFRVAGYLSLRGVAADPTLTPEFPGITDKEDTSEWKLPFDDPQWSQQLIRKEYGDEFWDVYRATPKAYIALEAGVRMWQSRFGTYTSLRLAPAGVAAPTAQQLDELAQRYTRFLLEQLRPQDHGLIFEDVRANALEASKGGTPFGLLFLGFSFFLILSALLLVGLLYRLNLERRASQVGLLFAQGFPRATVRRLLLGEGGALAVVGALVGLVAALWYSRALVQLLTALWPGGVLQSFLVPHWTWPSLLAGAGGACLVSLVTIAWVVRGLGKVSPRALLAGQTTEDTPQTTARWGRWWKWLGVTTPLLGLALLLAAPWLQGHEAKAGTFFGAGACFLTAGLAAVLAWLNREDPRPVQGHGWRAIGWLGLRNAARHPGRSLLTIGLIASAAFLLVAVESFRRRAHAGDGSKEAPDGGFTLVAESDLPLIRDLNTPKGREELLDLYEFKLTQRNLAPAEAKLRSEQAEQLLRETTIVALRSRSGDDASCLNLYQPRTPRVLGVPQSLIDRGGFVFAGTLSPSAAERENPWRLLMRDGEAIPAFGEGNTVLWMLKSGLGGTLTVPDGRGEAATVQISGLLQESVFQSSLLISEERFLKLYPEQEGYNVFLIAPPQGQVEAVQQILETALEDRGFVATRSQDRVAEFLAVENTYLTTFQALGGLGLVLGSLGLAVVLLRAVWERRGELALLRAVGWSRRLLGWLVLAENLFLLLVGLVVGTAAALLSILPQLLTGAGAVPVGNLLLLFAVVLIVALGAGALAVAGTLRAPLVPALRRE